MKENPDRKKNIFKSFKYFFLRSSIQYLRDLNVIRNNEVEKIIKYIYVLKLFLQNNNFIYRVYRERKVLEWIELSLFLSREKLVEFSYA